MKNPVRKFFVFAVIAGALVLTSFKVLPSSQKYLMVRSVEITNGLYDSYIFIVDENGKTEEIDLKTFKPKNIIQNTTKLNEVLNEVTSRGYELHSASGTGEVFVINTYIFIKK